MFLSTQEVYQIGLNKEETDFFEQLKSKGQSIDCLIFLNDLVENSEELVLVQKILAAAKLQPNQYAIINLSQYPNLKLRFFDANHFPLLQHIIGFGVDAAQIGWHTNSFKYQFFSLGKFEMVLVDDATTLLGDSRKKSMLWNEMKKMFEIA
jgi:hypothetical protein